MAHGGNDLDRCSVCKGPYHPATGHYISAKMRWCGPCTREHVTWLKGHMNRRWGDGRFYDHAQPPPPAVEQLYVFSTTHMVPNPPGSRSSFLVTQLRSRGVTLEEAYLRVADQIPEGHRVWCWHLDGSNPVDSVVE